jgi:hypothetical protein
LVEALGLVLDFMLIRHQKNKETGGLKLAISEPLTSSPLPWFSASANTSALVHALLQAAPGEKLIGAREVLSPRQLAEAFAEALEKDLEFVDFIPASTAGNPELEKSMFDLVGWCVEFRYDGAKFDTSVIQPAELGVPVALGSAKEWFAKQDWEPVFQTD